MTVKVQFFRMDRFKAICSFEFACDFTQFLGGTCFGKF